MAPENSTEKFLYFSQMASKFEICTSVAICFMLVSCDIEFWKDKSPVIAEVDDSRLTVEQIKEFENNASLSKAEWASSVEHWINFEVMYKEALKRNLQKDPVVKKLIKDAERKILVDRLRLSIDNSVNLENESEMQEYYKNNRDLFRIGSDSAETFIPFSNVQNQIRNAVLSEKQLAKEKIWLNEVKNTYSIEVYLQYLDSL